jgi:CHAT domain-containing protein/tetratricopeptide (TPR) repeat protein
VVKMTVEKGWEYLNQLIYQLYEEGEIDSATTIAEQTVRLSKLIYLKDHCNLAASIGWLALLYEFQGRLSEAEPLHKDTLEMYRRLFSGIDHSDLASSINNLAVLYKSQGQFAKAEPLYIEALAINRRLLNGRDHHDLAASINNLAQLYQSQGKLYAAKPLCEEVLGMCRRLFMGKDHSNLAGSMNNLALLHQSQGELESARLLYEEALAMSQRILRGADHHSIATSINNLAALHNAQGRFITAESLYKDALNIFRRLFKNKDHNDLATSINSLSLFYQSQRQSEKAFPLMLEAVEVEENILRQWFSYSNEENRLGFVVEKQTRLKSFVSLLCQYFPNDREKIAQVAIAVARRKAFAAQAEVELNYQRYGDKYPDLAADFQELATAQGKLTYLNHTYYHHQGAMDDAARESHQQVKQTLTEQIDQLERKLSANVPELRQLQQHVTLPAIFAALPEDSCAVEFYRFDVYNFGANEWQAPQYVAFILVPGGNVGMVKLGDAGEIDGLIRRYRDLACDANLPSFGARPSPVDRQPNPSPEVEEISIDLQLSQRLLTPILESIDLETKQLIFIPDGALHTLPIGNLPVGSDPRLLEEVGDLGGLLNDRFVCTYLSTLRELITRSDRPNRSLNQSIAIGNPNYNYLASALTPQLFEPIPESELLLDSLKLQLESDAQFFTGDQATETVLVEAKSPKLLVIITHGELLNRDGDPMQNHGLALTGANSWLAGEQLPAEIGKGFLLARDVAYLDLLGTEIVFLIACSSGLGDVKTGEGVFGLRRAFAIAGVKQLITSLWDVPTRPTMLLTDKFFEEYHRGVAPSISLQTAQHYVRDIGRTNLESTSLGQEILDELEDYKKRYNIRIADPNYPLRHPYFWGAWICQGV